MKRGTRSKLPPSLSFLVNHSIIPLKVAEGVLSQANGKTPVTLLLDEGHIDLEEAELARMCDVSPRKRAAAQRKYAASRAKDLNKELRQLKTVIANSGGGWW